VNISSVFGLLGIPSQSAYNASKFAVRGFTEALRVELDMAGGAVSCTTIHPGGIKTNIARSGRFDEASLSALGQDPDRIVAASERALRTTPERAAQVILRAVELDRRRAMIGAAAQVFKLLALTPPGLYQRLIRLGTRIWL
jgi:butyryl-CoA dehydrogenase